jgi:hypothetical protein
MRRPCFFNPGGNNRLKKTRKGGALAAEAAEGAVVMLRSRVLLDRRAARGQIDVVRDALDGADRDEDGVLRLRLGEKRPQRLEGDCQDGKVGGDGTAMPHTMSLPSLGASEQRESRRGNLTHRASLPAEKIME